MDEIGLTTHDRIQRRIGRIQESKVAIEVAGLNILDYQKTRAVLLASKGKVAEFETAKVEEETIRKTPFCNSSAALFGPTTLLEACIRELVYVLRAFTESLYRFRGSSMWYQLEELPFLPDERETLAGIRTQIEQYYFPDSEVTDSRLAISLPLLINLITS